MRFVRQTQTIRVTNFDDRLMIKKKIHKHGNMLPISISDIICSPSNCGKTSVDKLAGKFTRRTLRERGHIHEIVSTTEVSILEEFTCADRRNWLFYIL